MSKEPDKDYIDVIEDSQIHQDTHGDIIGHPTFPNAPYPGYSVSVPTCSEPDKKNKGCDAWDKCTTKGAGPYVVAFINPSGMQSSCHCRQWMRSLRYKPDYEVIRGEVVYEPFSERVAVDVSDPKKRYRMRTGKMRVKGVKDPIALAAQMNPNRKGRKPEQDVIDDGYSEVVPADEITEKLTHGYRGTDDQSNPTGGERPVGSQGNRKGRGRPKGAAERAVGSMPGQE